MRSTLCLLMFLALVVPLAAQEEPAEEPTGPWSYSLQVNAGLSQASFSNWAAGGENSLAYSSGLEGTLDYEPGEFFWNNELSLAFAQTKQGDADFRTSTDSIDFATRSGYALSPLARLFAEATLNTQFAPGYTYEAEPPAAVSAFADPLYMSQSAGVESKWFEWWSTRLSFGLKETLTDEYTAWSDDPETTEVETTKIEGGAFFTSHWQLAINEIVSFDSQLDVFAPFDELTVMDVDWVNSLGVSLTGWLQLSAGLKLRYDEDEITEVQLSQTSALQVTVKLP
jgi:hypothetical protein